MKKTKIVLFSLIFLLIVISNNVYGGFADYTDEDAAIDTEKLIEEHNTNFDIAKSSNNYLKSLNIDKGELSPTFDKQITNYNLAIANDIEEIVISANTEDDKANINGIGKINIKEIKQFNIEVTAESGTVRTYFINIVRPDEKYTNNTLNQENENLETEMTETDTSTKTNKITEIGKSNNKSFAILVGVVIGIVICILVIISILVLKKQNNYN